MIFVIGEYLIELKENNNIYEINYGGHGLISSISCMKNNVQSAFLSPISSDKNGIKIVNYLVDEEILFDPDLCNNNFPSPLLLKSQNDNGKEVDEYYIKNTAILLLTSEELLNTLSNHSDIKVISLGSFSMLMNPSSSSILDVISFMSPKPNIYIDANLNDMIIENVPNWRKRLFDYYSLAKIIKLSSYDVTHIFPEKSQNDIIEEIREINKDAHIIFTNDYSNISWVTNKNQIISQKNNKIKIINNNNTNSIFSGALLAALAKEGVFGEDGESPRFRINENKIINSLKEAINSINN